MKTSELTGVALDWAVAKCEGDREANDPTKQDDWDLQPYSTDWAQGGTIIERERLTVTYNFNDYCFEAYYTGSGMNDDYERGTTPLIAAMRCYVASKLGDEVEVPECF